MKYYGMLIIDIRKLQTYFNDSFGVFLIPGIQMDEYEDLYDWCVNEAFTVVHLKNTGSKVRGHFKHDLYKCFYDNIKSFFEMHLRYNPPLLHQQWGRDACIKVLITGSSMTIAIERNLYG